MKVFICAVLLAVVAVNGQYPKPPYKAPSYPSPSYPSYSPPAYPKPSYPSYPKPSYPQTYEAPMPYNFAWAVKDDYTYNNYKHEESGDDKGYVTGSYSVLLPDGRTQTVDYKADDYTGYVADVKYDGEAKYPEYKNEYKPAAYKPAAYKPSYPEYKPAYPEYKPAYPEYKPGYPEYKPAYPKPSYPSYPSYPAPKYPAPKYPSKY